GVFKRGPPFWGFLKPPKIFPPGGKFFPRGKIFGGPPFSPQKGGKPPGVFKTPRGFLKGGPPFWGFLKPPKIFPPGGKFFPRGKIFGGPLFPPKGENPRGF
ncbi:hypothetical protein NV63_18630, partial [Elizabethkingia anophelis]